MSDRLDTAGRLAAALGRLAAQDPVMGALASRLPAPELRLRPGGFAGLASVVVGQQVSTASAAAIHGRLVALLPAMTAGAFAARSDAELAAAGLSRAKIATLRAVAEAVLAGDLDLDGLEALPADLAHARLVALKGIGSWTADVYLLFCLGHPDAFPAGDLAIQEAMRLAGLHPVRPDARMAARLAERWRPLRGAAAYCLWTLYREAKGREAVPPGA